MIPLVLVLGLLVLLTAWDVAENARPEADLTPEYEGPRRPDESTLPPLRAKRQLPPGIAP